MFFQSIRSCSIFLRSIRPPPVLSIAYPARSTFSSDFFGKSKLFQTTFNAILQLFRFQETARIPRRCSYHENLRFIYIYLVFLCEKITLCWVYFWFCRSTLSKTTIPCKQGPYKALNHRVRFKKRISAKIIVRVHFWKNNFRKNVPLVYFWKSKSKINIFRVYFSWLLQIMLRLHCKMSISRPHRLWKMSI